MLGEKGEKAFPNEFVKNMQILQNPFDNIFKSASQLPMKCAMMYRNNKTEMQSKEKFHKIDLNWQKKTQEKHSLDNRILLEKPLDERSYYVNNWQQQICFMLQHHKNGNSIVCQQYSIMHIDCNKLI